MPPFSGEHQLFVAATEYFHKAVDDTEICDVERRGCLEGGLMACESLAPRLNSLSAAPPAVQEAWEAEVEDWDTHSQAAGSLTSPGHLRAVTKVRRLSWACS